MKNLLLRSLLLVLAFAGSALAQESPVAPRAASVTATATGAGNTAVTATIPALVSQCIYVTDVYIAIVANAAVTGAAGPAPIFTTTGLPTNLVWWGENGTLGTGVLKVVTDKHYTNPLKVTPATAFTIVTSAGQSTESVRINVLAYYANCS